MRHSSSFSLALVACIVLNEVASFSSLTTESGKVENADSDEITLLQKNQVVHSHRHSADLPAVRQHTHADREICADMENQGSYFTVQVQVGTPGQTFEIVADTGSNALIVPDCKCVKTRQCSTLENCFNTKQSTSFMMQTFMIDGVEAVESADLGYGSGDISCTIASDLVSLKEARAQMQNAIFLMEDRMSLAVDGSFEGILGLGLPGADLGMETKLFMPEAGIRRYSMCFNDDEPGVLRMNIPPLVNPMKQIGQVHWGLDLQGMSVGDTSAEVLFCDPASKSSLMETACGAIPDSGTTLMMGPKDQILTLHAAICDNWKRCSDLATADPKRPKSLIFTQLLSNCSDWLDEASNGIYEMPPIKIHLAGKEGVKQEIEISPWSYVFQTIAPTFKIINERVLGLGNFPLLVPGKIRSYCTAAFGAQDYSTLNNGPVWILGSPLFYENTVSFDLETKAESISIQQKPCSACKASLLDSGAKQQRHRALRHVPTIRWPSIKQSKQQI